MPEKDLRALFRTNLVDLDAMQVFANRDDERSTFDRALDVHWRLVRDAKLDPQDLATPRRNVLMYYGVGGIGKTTLSKQLQRRLSDRDADPPADWPPVTPTHGKILTVRLDLGREAGMDVENLVLLLRAALAPVGHPMIAFDLALARYWERAKRQNLSEYLHRHGVIGRVPSAARLPALVNQAVGEVSALTGLAGLGLLVQTGPRLVAYLRDLPRQRHAISSCLRLPDLLESEPSTESLSYYPHLLAWDLWQLQQRLDISLVVFLDTFEEISGQADRELERIVQRMVWLMPNVFFVISGRNRLDWTDPALADRLDRVGQAAWPGLDSGTNDEPRQHLVGFISEVDSHRYLQQRLARQQEPVIPADVRQRIVRNAHGLPLYLDLSVMRYLSMISAGQSPRPDDFDGGFPSIVSRVFRDLEEKERAVLRATSLLDAFDVELATVAAGVTSEAPARQLIRRPFVRHDPGAPWSYHVHHLVREQIRAADAEQPDSWTEADWRAAAERALAQVGRAVRSGQPDRRLLIAGMNQGFRLAHEFDLPLEWLTDAAYRYIEDSVWEPTLRPSIADEVESAGAEPHTAAQALAAGLVAITRRQRMHREHARVVLDRCLATGLLHGDVADLLQYFRAECLRDLGRLAESEAGMAALIGPDRRMSEMALRGVCHLQRRRGRFRQLRSGLDTRRPVGVWRRVWGDLWWTQARLSEAINAYRDAVAWAERQRLAGEAATSAACLCWAAALHSLDGGTEAVRRARRLLEPVTITWAELQVGCAELVLAAGDGAQVEQRYTELQERAFRHGLTSSAAYADVARAFHYATVADTGGLAEARRALSAQVKGEEFGYLREIIDFWGGEPAAAHAPAADWLDGRDATMTRWQRIIHERQRALSERR